MSKTMQGVHYLCAHMSREVSSLEVVVVCAVGSHGRCDCARGGAGGSGDAGGEEDDAAGATVAVFPAEGALALVVGITGEKFNVEDFLATSSAFGR